MPDTNTRASLEAERRLLEIKVRGLSRSIDTDRATYGVDPEDERKLDRYLDRLDRLDAKLN